MRNILFCFYKLNTLFISHPVRRILAQKIRIASTSRILKLRLHPTLTPACSCGGLRMWNGGLQPCLLSKQIIQKILRASERESDLSVVRNTKCPNIERPLFAALDSRPEEEDEEAIVSISPSKKRT